MYDKFSIIYIIHIIILILRFVDRPSLFNLFQIKPTRCTLLLSILFQLLYMFRATVCPSSEELTVSERHWYFSLYMGGCFVMMGTQLLETCTVVEMNILRSSVHLVSLIKKNIILFKARNEVWRNRGRACCICWRKQKWF